VKVWEKIATAALVAIAILITLALWIKGILVQFLWVMINFTAFMIGPISIIGLIMLKLLGLRGIRSVLTYEKKDSPVHRVDPRVKFLYVLCVSLLSALLGWYPLLIGLSLATLIPWLYARPSKTRAKAVLYLCILPLFGMAWGQGLYFGLGFDWPVTIIYRIPQLKFNLSGTHSFPAMIGLERITIEGLRYGFLQGFRVVAVNSAALLVLITTRPSDLVFGLIKMFLPYEIGFMVLTAIRFIPKFLHDAGIVLNAEKARGLDMSVKKSYNPVVLTGTLARVIRGLSYVTIPVVISAMRSGKNLAVAAETRAFRAKSRRTYLREIKMTRKDKILSIILIAIMIAGVVLSYLGYGAPPGGVT